MYVCMHQEIKKLNWYTYGIVPSLHSVLYVFQPAFLNSLNIHFMCNAKSRINDQNNTFIFKGTHTISKKIEIRPGTKE